MDYIPIWEPSDGTGKGFPNYQPPTTNFHMSSITTTSMAVTILGSSATLENPSGTGLTYTSADGTITITLSSAPSALPNVQEYIDVVVTDTSQGIMNANYATYETGASSNTFKGQGPGIVLTLTQLDPNAVDALSIELYTFDGLRYNLSVVETGPDTYRFIGTGFTLDLLLTPSLTSGPDTLIVQISNSEIEIPNSVVTVSETAGTSLIFRNFDPPVPTDLGIEPVNEEAPFYYRVPAINLTSGQTPLITFKADVEGSETTLGVATLVDDPERPGWYRSEKPILLLLEAADQSEMTTGDADLYQVIKWPELAQLDWKSSDKKELTIEYGAASKKIKVQPPAVVLHSINLPGPDFLYGVDTKGNFTKPLVF